MFSGILTLPKPMSDVAAKTTRALGSDSSAGCASVVQLARTDKRITSTSSDPVENMRNVSRFVNEPELSVWQVLIVDCSKILNSPGSNDKRQCSWIGFD